MNAPTDKVAPRKRKTPQRRVPALIEERERKPLIFGWGADLNHREREALKERIALFAGIALAVIVAALVGWGLLQDNVIGPANQRAADEKPVASIGTATITMGFFKRFEQFRSDQLNNQLNQLQQQQQQLNADPKKNAAQLAQVGAEISGLQQSQATIGPSALQLLLDNQAMLQRAHTVGVVATPKEVNSQLIDVMKNVGGRRHFQQFLQTSKLSYDEFKTLVTADVLRGKLAKKLGASVSPYETKVRARHILIATPKKALAEKLLAKVRHGADIAALAKRYSIDTGTKLKGGDLGYFGRGTMVTSFDKAAFAMKVGEVRLVKSQYGWHIIKVIGRHRAHMTSQELQQAQDTAVQTWLRRQQGILHVQRFVAIDKLPAPAQSSNSAGATGQSGSPLQQMPVRQQPPKSSNSKSKKP